MNKEELERLFRKYSNNMVISGISVIFFGFWSLFKFIMVATINGFKLSDYTTSYNNYTTFDIVFFYIILALLWIIVTFIQFYIGYCAILLGRGKKKRRAFLVLALIILLSTIYSLQFYFLDDPSKTSDTTAASIMVDLALCFALLDMLISAFKRRQVKKSLGRM